MDDPAAPSAARSRLMALIVASALFMQGLDSTIITTALPSMALSFGVKPSDLSVGLTSYMLAIAALLPISGWIADRLGPRTVLAGAIVVFTGASILCALAPNLWAFVAARALQGLGAALVGPVGRLVVLRNTAKTDLLNAIALIIWPSLAAPIIGPALGGLIVSYAAWPWIFLVNIPIGVAGLAMVIRFIPNDRAHARHPLDWLGLIAASTSLICIVGGLEAVAHSAAPWGPGAVVAAGVVIGALAVRRFAGHPYPLIPLGALATQTFAVASLWGGTAFRMTVFATPFLLPLMFQVGFGLSPVHSGLLLLAYFAGNLAMKPLTTPLLRRFGFRGILIVFSLLSGGSIAACALFGPATPDWAMAAVLLFSGAARSMQFTSLDTLTYADVEPADRAGATTLAGVTSQVGAVLGIALSAILLNASSLLRGADQVATPDFRLAFVCLGLVSLISLPTYLRLPRSAGAEVTGRR